ncbi:unnamed protein product [Boreogadus saida]
MLQRNCPCLPQSKSDRTRKPKRTTQFPQLDSWNRHGFYLALGTCCECGHDSSLHWVLAVSVAMVLPGIGYLLCPSPRLPAVTTGLKSITVSGASSSPCCPEPEQDVHPTAQVPLDQGGPEAEDQTPWTRNGAPGWTGACGPDPLDQEWGTRMDRRLWTRRLDQKVTSSPGPGMGHQAGPEAVDQKEWGTRLDQKEWGTRLDQKVTSSPGPGMGHQGGPEAVDQIPWTRNGAPGWNGGCGPEGMGPQGGPEGNLTPWTRNGGPGWTRGYHHKAVLKCLSPRDVGELTAEPWWREADGAVVEEADDQPGTRQVLRWDCLSLLKESLAEEG